MSSEIQDPAAVKKHTMAAKADSGKTCIDCHKGIAHELPKDGHPKIFVVYRYCISAIATLFILS